MINKCRANGLPRDLILPAAASGMLLLGSGTADHLLAAMAAHVAPVALITQLLAAASDSWPYLTGHIDVLVRILHAPTRQSPAARSKRCSRCGAGRARPSGGGAGSGVRPHADRIAYLRRIATVDPVATVPVDRASPSIPVDV